MPAFHGKISSVDKFRPSYNFIDIQHIQICFYHKIYRHFTLKNFLNFFRFFASSVFKFKYHAKKDHRQNNCILF